MFNHDVLVLNQSYPYELGVHIQNLIPLIVTPVFSCNNLMLSDASPSLSWIQGAFQTSYTCKQEAQI